MEKGQKDTLKKIETDEQAGRILRPYNEDGFVNVMTKYGTQKDSSEQYYYQAEPDISDMELIAFYEGNGLFAKVIDAPAEEAVKHGFKLDLKDDKLTKFYERALDELDFDDVLVTGIEWARLFGGAIAVMFINDGRGLEEPVNWKAIRGIDDIQVFDRSMVIPSSYYITQNGYHNDYRRGSGYSDPEYYDVFSETGNFRVHESRCLIFKNGKLPRYAHNSIYRLWGMPEYVRIHRSIRDAEIAHGSAIKLLDRAVQAVYSMNGLAQELATEGGEERVLRRMNTIDMARGLFNTITIDGEGESYDFRQFSFTGVSEVIDTTCNYVSALTNIPQTILFGRSPAGMNATGKGDLENWYNYVERIQKKMLRRNIDYLLDVIFQAGYNRGYIDEKPEFNIEFNPLWSYTEEEQVAVDQQKANVEQTRATTAGAYINMQVLDPSEVRKSLAKSGEFDVETMLDDYTEEELEENKPEPPQDMGGMIPQNGSGNAENNPQIDPNAKDEEIPGQDSEDEINGVLTHQGVMNRLTDAFHKYAPTAAIKKALADIQYKYLRRKVDRLKKSGIIHIDGNSEEKWVTINGTPVKIEDGKIASGPKPLRDLGKKTGRKKASDREAKKEKDRAERSEADKAKDAAEKEAKANELKRKLAESRKKHEEEKKNSPEYQKYGDAWEKAENEYNSAMREHRPVKASAAGCNKFVRGFDSRNLVAHWEGNVERGITSHKDEFPGMTMDEYEKRGLELIQMPVGGDILGHVNENNQVIRFNRSTGEFVKGDPNRGCATFMKAHYNAENYDLRSALRYYEGQREKDLANGGRLDD